MASNLVLFLQRLNTDPTVVGGYEKDPDAAMDEANLSTAEKELLRSGDPVRIRQAVAQDLGLEDGITERPKLIVEITVTVRVQF